MPTTWMIAPRIITPRNANKLRKPRQQLSGTATASNKNRFMAKYVVSGFAPDLILTRLVVQTTSFKKFRNQGQCQMHGGISTACRFMISSLAMTVRHGW
jgi:hypothetical protein